MPGFLDTSVLCPKDPACINVGSLIENTAPSRQVRIMSGSSGAGGSKQAHWWCSHTTLPWGWRLQTRAKRWERASQISFADLRHLYLCYTGCPGITVSVWKAESHSSPSPDLMCVPVPNTSQSPAVTACLQRESISSPHSRQKHKCRKLKRQPKITEQLITALTVPDECWFKKALWLASKH